MLDVAFVRAARKNAALAVGVHKGGILRPSARALGDVEAMAESLPSIPRFQGEEGGEGEILMAFTEGRWVALLGMGDVQDLDASRLRNLGGDLFAGLSAEGFSSLAVALDLDAHDAAELAYGMCLRAWRIPARYRSKPDPEDAWTLTRVEIVVADIKAAEARFARLKAVADGVLYARDLVVAPGNELYPATFARTLKDLEKLGIEVEILNEARLEDDGLNLLLAVGRGSAHPPCLAVLRWKGAKGAPLCFVGKGITFDSGGITIKDDEDMDEMKGDMAGAAAVAGALRALALRKAPVHAVGVLAIAENMVSGSAQRPGDVVRSYVGLTVEVVDTDAEGRLALADALAFAARTEKPVLMVDLATLTGAVEVTLGKEKAGLFSNDDDLAEKLMEIGDDEDEPLWRLPLTDVYDDAIKSLAADLKNCSWDELTPDAVNAARFLQHFVPEDMAWAHLDIAGMSEAEEDGSLAAEGPTGFGVRLLDRLAERMGVE